MKNIGCSILFFLTLFLGYGILFPKTTVSAKIVLENQREHPFYDELGNKYYFKTHDIVEHKKGKKKVLADEVTSDRIVMDGNYLYYSKNDGAYGKIYKIDLKDGKRSYVTKKKGGYLLGGTKGYLYLSSKDEFFKTFHDNLEIYEIKKKMKKNLSNIVASHLHVKKNKVILVEAKTDVSNRNIEVYNLSGKKVFFVEGLDCNFYKGRLQYTVLNETDFAETFFSISLDGKSKKTITREQYQLGSY